MSDKFNRAYQALGPIEGGYVNHADDRGGETYCGIARRFHPDWSGWITIDQIKRAQEIKTGAHFEQLDDLVIEFYRVNFWQPIGGHLLPYPVAFELYEQAVNFGVHAAAKALQRAVNAMNRNGDDWDDVDADGRFGPRTLSATQAAIARRSANNLVRVLNVVQGSEYLRIVENDPTQETFFNGWVQQRVNLQVSA